MKGALGLAIEIRQPKREADEYIRDNVWFGYTDDAYFDRTWDVIGEDKSMWGLDYPHPRNTFPTRRRSSIACSPTCLSTSAQNRPGSTWPSCSISMFPLKRWRLRNRASDGYNKHGGPGCPPFIRPPP